MFFVIFILKNFFINSTKHVFLFLRTKTVFQNSVPKHNFFFLKHQKLFLKIVLKNCFPEQFSKTATKQTLNFNNFRKKKNFVGGSVMVGWSSPL